jgi:hypothetical protein
VSMLTRVGTQPLLIKRREELARVAGECTTSEAGGNGKNGVHTSGHVNGHANGYTNGHINNGLKKRA